MYEIPELTCAYRPHTTSSCAYSCVAPFLNCDSTISTKGCLINSNTDSNNCGGCGNVCSALNNAVSNGCVLGACDYSCKTGFGNCDATSADCETDLTTNSNHCGACSNVCALAGDNAALVGCVSSKCAYTCSTGFGNCDSNAADCETPLTTTTNCGACGTECSLQNAVSDCSTGSCVVSSCNGRFDNCNTIDSDGCEANLDSSVDHCNACNSPCAAATEPNTEAVCSLGTCTYPCSTGFADCDALVAGCETDIRTTDNCGACGAACELAGDNASLDGCVSGKCEYSCNDGFGDCDTNAADCETPLTTTSNCGACGTVCALAGDNAILNGCVSGECAYTCNVGFGNCDATSEDCETSLTTTSNCGACGNVCSLPHASEQCLAGQCAVLSCDAGYGNCNTNQADGCETKLSNDEQNCGACGHACDVNHHCKNGSCIPRHNYDDK